MILGPLLGAGRTSDVYAVDDDRVLRRVRPGIDLRREEAALVYATEHGYPAPRLLRVDGQDMLMERLHGPTMLAALGAGELSIDEAAAVLADLLQRLHALPPRPGAADGARLLHLDLHPDNVMLTPAGPTVIDWSNARDGVPALDVALSAVILAQVAVDGEHPAAPAARALLAAFLGHRLEFLGELDAAAALRTADPMMTGRELELVPVATALVVDLAR